MTIEIAAGQIHPDSGKCAAHTYKYPDPTFACAVPGCPGAAPPTPTPTPAPVLHEAPTIVRRTTTACGHWDGPTRRYCDATSAVRYLPGWRCAHHAPTALAAPTVREAAA